MIRAVSFVSFTCLLLLNACAPPASSVLDESAFRIVTKSAFDPDPNVGGWPGLALFDYDNDGDIDVFITSRFPNMLYQNDGSGNFTDVANEAGVRFSQDGGVCVGVGDFDNDGWLDMVIGRQIDQAGLEGRQSLRFLRNLGPDDDGTVRFADATEQTGLASVDFGASIGVGDFDNDGLLDLYIGRYDFRDLLFELETYLPDTPNVLLRNTGIVEGGVPLFEDVTESAGVAGTRVPGLAPDNEDMLNRMPTFATYITDVNNDGFQDIFALQEIPGGVDLFINNGDMTFTSVQTDLLNKHGGWMGIASSDYDRDGDLDYFLTNVGSDARGDPISTNHLTSAWRRDSGTPFHRLLANDRTGTLTDVAADTPVAKSALPPDNALGGKGLQGFEFGFGAAFFDIQNDGWPDLTWTGDLTSGSDITGPFRPDFHGVSRLLSNDGDGSFTDVTGSRGFFLWSRSLPLEFGHSREGRALGAIDLNGDGFADICRTIFGTSDGFQCLMNPANTEGNWITIRLEGTISNRFGIGARVEAVAGEEVFVGEVVTTTSAFTAVHPQVHFGLGGIDTLDSLTVRWPSGTVTEETEVAVNRILTIHEE